MSLWSNPITMIFLLSSTLSIIAAIFIVYHKSIVYSAFFLSMLGVGNAILFALLGFPIISLFHLSVYVGAAVTFILFSVAMLKEAPSVEPPIKALAVLSVIILTIILIKVLSPFSAEPSFFLNYRELTSLLVTKYWFALIVAAMALMTALIGAITIARREV